MYAIVKTEAEANQLNDYIKNGYYNEVPGANFEQWTEVAPVIGGFAVEIMDFMKYRPVPEFIVNGIKFISEIETKEL
jgi:hypothetical protein